jgi:FAD/FMN-containing dehydrogenase
MTAPDGQPVIAFLVCYNGPIAEGEAALRPLRAFGPPLVDDVRPMPYTELQAMLDAGFPAGLQVYWRSHFLAHLNDDAIDALLGRFTAVTSPLSVVIIEQVGGAVSRVGRDATAFDHRDSLYNVAIVARWEDPATADAHIAWARDLWEATRPFASGVYVNYLGVGDSADRVRDAYHAAKYERLAALKAKYDPTNLFRLNQNIPPAA